MHIGSLKLNSNILAAPLAGCSDYSFRLMLRKYTKCLMFCEMVKMEAIINNILRTFDMLKFNKDMHPIGAQIFGSNPDLAEESVNILQEMGFDILDFNCGCPVHKVNKDGSGAAILKTPKLIFKIVENMVKASKVPVTVKLRLGWDKESINILDICKGIEDAGASAITIHGRTRSELYSGKSNWEYIKLVKSQLTIPVIGNGDINSTLTTLEKINYTGCDGVMIGRATLGNPFLIREIEQYFDNNLTKIEKPKTLDMFIQHLDLILKNNSEEKAILDIRRVGCWYLKSIRDIKNLRSKISKVNNLKEINDIINQLKVLP